MVILSAVDVDRTPERPIRAGYDLATTYDDELVVLYVMTEEEFRQWEDDREALPASYNERGLDELAAGAAKRQAAQAVEEALTEYERDRVSTRGAVGSPVEEILAAVDELYPRYVVVGGRNRSPVRQTLFGSVSQEVIRKADRPVVSLVEGNGGHGVGRPA